SAQLFALPVTATTRTCAPLSSPRFSDWLASRSGRPMHSVISPVPSVCVPAIVRLITLAGADGSGQSRLGEPPRWPYVAVTPSPVTNWVIAASSGGYRERKKYAPSCV